MNVIATGMVSALGYDVRTACAAARAGVSRAGELPFLTLEGDASPGLATGHVAHLLTDGFEGDARLARLLSGAFTDLVSQVSEGTMGGARIAYYLSLPPADRAWQGLGAIATAEVREQYLDRMGPTRTPDEGARGRALLERALRLARLSGPMVVAARTARVSTAGHAAGVGLYTRARSDLDAGHIDVAIVGGVDAMVDPATLSWLSATGRLKSAESPTGLSPGEAAALVMLARPGAVVSGAAARAVVSHATTRVSATHQGSPEPPDGRSQSEIVRALLDATGVDGLTWVITDQNGEMFRAAEWGNSLVHLRAAKVQVHGTDAVWYPVSSFGDVGAASGVVATCMAVEAFGGRYAPASHAVLLTSSDGPARAGCIVTTFQD